MTKPATSIEYATIPVATVVGGTLNAFTIPPNETGKEATLNDMIIWPSAMAIIGTQDSCRSVAALDCVDMFLGSTFGEYRQAKNA
jgi:hypothetical protein